MDLEYIMLSEIYFLFKGDVNVMSASVCMSVSASVSLVQWHGDLIIPFRN